MNPSREEALFILAGSKAAERTAFLDRECAGDPALRQGVEALVLALCRNVRRITPRGWSFIERTNLAGSMETPERSNSFNSIRAAQAARKLLSQAEADQKVNEIVMFSAELYPPSRRD
jgi:hypothetical protein